MASHERPRATTRVVLDRGLDPFSRLSDDQRRRLLVRVLCELVAYDEPDQPDQADGAATPTPAVTGERAEPLVPVAG